MSGNFAHMTATTRTRGQLASMPRRNRLNNGNGPDDYRSGQPSAGMGQTMDEFGAADSATRGRDGTVRGGGTAHRTTDVRNRLEAFSPCDNHGRSNFLFVDPSRLNFDSQRGGDDTFLTPYASSRDSDSTVDSLADVFLAMLSIHDGDSHRDLPDMHDDPVPLLSYDWTY
jgi:hypothetical protein